MSLAVERYGEGMADCVLVHGWGLNHAVWSDLSARLGAHCRLHAVDLPGHGSSSAGSGGLDAWAGRLAGVVPGPAVWIAWSLGGVVSLRMAQWRPDRVRALVLIDISPRFAVAADWPWGAPASLLEEFARRLETDFYGLLHEFVALNARGAQAGAARALRQLRDAVALAPPTREGLRQGLDILRTADLRAALPHVHVPVLVVNGERDRLTHPQAARWMAQALPDGEYCGIGGAAHAPFLSHADVFGDRVIDFLRRRGILPSADGI